MMKSRIFFFQKFLALSIFKIYDNFSRSFIFVVSLYVLGMIRVLHKNYVLCGEPVRLNLKFYCIRRMCNKTINPDFKHTLIHEVCTHIYLHVCGTFSILRFDRSAVSLSNLKIILNYS